MDFVSLITEEMVRISLFVRSIMASCCGEERFNGIFIWELNKEIKVMMGAGLVRVLQRVNIYIYSSFLETYTLYIQILQGKLGSQIQVRKPHLSLNSRVRVASSPVNLWFALPASYISRIISFLCIKYWNSSVLSTSPAFVVKICMISHHRTEGNIWAIAKTDE